MRESFENRLGQFNELTKNELEDLPKEEKVAQDSELQELLEKFAKEDHREIDTQAEIFDLQKEKQKIMQSLKEWKQEQKEDQVEINYEDGRFFDAKRNEITKGELLTDGDWGVKYYLDPDSVPKSVIKKYLVEDAKRKLRDLLDRQIAIQEIEVAKDFRKQETYKKVKGKIERGGEIKEMGLAAELMVKNFLKKLALDYDVAFDVLEVDVYQDVEQKLDFIIARRPYFRRVEVDPLKDDEHGEISSLGIQFTINSNKEVLDKKRRQIEKSKAKKTGGDIYEDIVLVHIDMKNIGQLFEKWSETKASGGPDKLLSQEVKKAIFFETLKDIVPKEELNEEWEKVFANL